MNTNKIKEAVWDAIAPINEAGLKFIPADPRHPSLLIYSGLRILIDEIGEINDTAMNKRPVTTDDFDLLVKKFHPEYVEEFEQEAQKRTTIKDDSSQQINIQKEMLNQASNQRQLEFEMKFEQMIGDKLHPLRFSFLKRVLFKTSALLAKLSYNKKISNRDVCSALLPTLHVQNDLVLSAIKESIEQELYKRDRD